jgi:hypothetical protein
MSRLNCALSLLAYGRRSLKSARTAAVPWGPLGLHAGSDATIVTGEVLTPDGVHGVAECVRLNTENVRIRVEDRTAEDATWIKLARRPKIQDSISRWARILRSEGHSMFGIGSGLPAGATLRVGSCPRYPDREINAVVMAAVTRIRLRARGEHALFCRTLAEAS